MVTKLASLLCQPYNILRQSWLLARFSSSVGTLSKETTNVLPPADPSREHASPAIHVPVCLHEAVSYLNPQNHKTYVDMTFGAGGHSNEILRRAPDAKLIVLDRDPLAYELAEKFASSNTKSSVLALHGKFTDLPMLLSARGIHSGTIDGFLFDVGASSMQFDQAERGFSLSKNGPLDMRMDSGRIPNQLSAADIVNNMEENGLYKIIKKYGEDSKAPQIARAIIDTRNSFGNITTTKQLADIVASVYQTDHRQDKLRRHAHVATKTFQALRIFVNNELNELFNGLEIAHHYLTVGGRCVVISFHSLEDRIVKRVFQAIDLDAQFNSTLGDLRRNARIHDREVVEKVMQKKWRVINKMVTPSEQSVIENPRARSAKLRAAEKTEI